MAIQHRKRSFMKSANSGPPQKRRQNNTLARAIAVALLAGSVLPASGLAATLTGFVFIDMEPSNGAWDSNESKVGGYSLKIQVGNATQQSIKTDPSGHFSFEFDDEGEPPISITNVNFPGWKQTTLTGTNTNGMTGRYTFQIESPYPEAEIGIAKGGIIVVVEELPEVLITEGSSAIGDNTLPIITECTSQSYQVKLICSLPEGTTDYEIKSCSWNFGDNSFGEGIHNGLPDHFGEITVNHSYKDAGTYPVELGAVIVNTDTNSSHYQTATYNLTAGNENSGDAFDCFCSPGRAKYKSDGNQIITNSNPTGIQTDVVYISHSVGVEQLNNVPLSRYGICVDTGGELTEASSGGNLKLPNNETSFVYNRGTIRIKREQHHVIDHDGNNSAVIVSSPAEQGGNVILDVVDFIINDSGGKIKAGIGGNYIDHSNSSSSGFNNDVQGQAGGDINLYAQLITNHGHIGPEQAIGYNSGNLVTDGGNGGVGSRTYWIRRTQTTPSDSGDCENWLSGTDSNQLALLPNGHSGGNAHGGDGGNITLEGQEIENWGTIKSGSGGDARTYECHYSGNIAYPGEPGDVNILPELAFRGNGTLDGSGGRVLLEPVTITASKGFRIKNASEVMIFGDEGSKIILDDLSADAISSEGDIILAVGEGGTIDLGNNTAQIFNSATGNVKIHADADKVILNDNITIQELANVPVEQKQAKILYAVTLSGTGVVKSMPNSLVTITVRVQNSGPTTDTYTLSVTDSEGWQLGALPNTVTVDGLKSKELTLNVTLPNTQGAVNTITVKATSQADSSVIATTKTQVAVTQQPTAEFSASTTSGVAPLTVDLDASASVDPDGNIVSYAWSSSDGQTATAQITALTFNDPGEYTITLDVTDSDEMTAQVQKTVTVQAPNQQPTAALAITPESGKAPLTVALNGSASTDTDGTIASYAWTASNGQTASGQNAQLTFNEAGDYTITLEVTDKDGATAQVQKTVSVQAPNQQPTAAVSVSPTSGKAPLTVKLDGSASTDTDGTIASYAWSASNGQTAEGQNAELTFNEAGEYTITLEVTDNDGATHSATSVQITVAKPGEYTAHGTLRDELGQPIVGAKVQIGDSTTTTDAAGNWEVTGLQEGDDYTVTASKDGYAFSSEDVALGNDEFKQNVTLKPISALTVKVVAKPSVVKQDENVTYTMTVINGGEETATNVALNPVLPAGTTLVSLEALDGGDCDPETLSCTLSDLVTGGSARFQMVINNTQTKALVTKTTVTANEYPADVAQKWTRVIPYLSVSISDTPDPLEMAQADVDRMLHYTLAVELSENAPSAATGVELVTTLPTGVELKAVNTDYGMCDTSEQPKLTCSLTDLSVDSADDISQVAVNVDVVLKDAGILVLTHEAKVTANEYPAHTDRERTKVFIPESVQVDIAFVIDNTGSMQEEINGVKKALIAFINEIDTSEAPLSVLLTFGDQVKYRAVTQDMTVLRDEIGNLKASGGGTCPEASYEAISFAIPHVKKGGTILFATDASPYEGSDVEEMIVRLRNKGIIFNAMIFGDCTDENSWNEQP